MNTYNSRFKYKAWDKNAKRMWEVTEINWRSTEQGGEIFYIRGNTEYNGHKNAPIGGHKDFCDRFDDIILLEFTGLCDKHDREIYAGYIIEDRWGKKYLVEWSNERSGWVPFANGTGCGCCEVDMVYNSGDVEVNGNRFENPELLEEVK